MQIPKCSLSQQNIAFIRSCTTLQLRIAIFSYLFLHPELVA
uniref:Uncharacterized protein n=1 Tax=Arundo donax TaxID=35708 RepID=A0A0A8YJN4_ARUDO